MAIVGIWVMWWWNAPLWIWAVGLLSLAIHELKALMDILDWLEKRKGG